MSELNYSIGQYIHKGGELASMTPITNVTCKGVSMKYGLENISGSIGFENTGFKYGEDSESFQAGNSYFVHCEIAKLPTSPQTFYIKLVNLDNLNKSQYIKTITVGTGETNENNMADITFSFTPVENFNTILFELQRTEEDSGKPRMTHILLRELNFT